MEFGSNMPAWSFGGEGIGVVRLESRGMEESRGFGGGIEAISWEAVSYTHLTLPTILLV